MRLIDADSLRSGLNSDSVIGAAMQSAIDEQPTIDPETLPIVRQLKTKNEVLLKLLSGERVEAESLVAATGWSFEQCCKRFEISRVAEWWSIVGKTDEERSRNGQKITCYFYLPQLSNKRGES